MAPIRPAGRLLASIVNSHSTLSSLPTRSPSLSTISVPSSPSHTPITPSIAFHRVTRVLLEHFNEKRDDSETTTGTYNKHLELIFPLIAGAIVLTILIATVRKWTLDHFRKGGTWKTWFEVWWMAAVFFLLITVFLPFTILGCFINCHTERKNKRNGNVANGSGAAAAPAAAANSLAGSGVPPPPLDRPQMPLDPVVVMPDLPDQEDPDAVPALPPPPPPILQKNETTDEATDRFFQDNNK